MIDKTSNTMDNIAIVLHYTYINGFHTPGRHLVMSVGDCVLDALPFDSLNILDMLEILRSEPGWHWKTQLPERYYNIWIVLEGKGTLACDGVTHNLQAGSAFILAPGQTVDATQDTEHRIRNFAAHVMPVKQGKPYRPENVFPQTSVHLMELGWIESLCKAAVRTYQYGDPLGYQQCKNMILQIMIEIVRSHHGPTLNSTEQRIEHLITSINEEPYVWRTLEDMAATVRLSPAQLSRKFKRRTGCTPVDYAIQLRIKRAAHMLLNSPMRIGEVAEAMGYQDIYFFSRQFSRFHGCSPSEYRNRNS